MISSENYVTNIDDNLVSEQNKFDKPTCQGDSVCDIFDNDKEIITENYIFWINTTKAIWQGKVVNITFSYLLQDSNH